MAIAPSWPTLPTSSFVPSKESIRKQIQHYILEDDFKFQQYKTYEALCYEMHGSWTNYDLIEASTFCAMSVHTHTTTLNRAFTKLFSDEVRPTWLDCESEFSDRMDLSCSFVDAGKLGVALCAGYSGRYNTLQSTLPASLSKVRLFGHKMFECNPDSMISMLTRRDQLVDDFHGLGWAKSGFLLELLHPLNKHVVCLDRHLLRVCLSEFVAYTRPHRDDEDREVLIDIPQYLGSGLTAKHRYNQLQAWFCEVCLEEGLLPVAVRFCIWEELVNPNKKKPEVVPLNEYSKYFTGPFWWLGLLRTRQHINLPIGRQRS